MTKETTIGELARYFDDLMHVPVLGTRMHPDGPQAKGFTIGKGKKLFWYICTSTKTGTYYAVSVDSRGKYDGVRYGLKSTTQATIQY